MCIYIFMYTVYGLTVNENEFDYLQAMWTLLMLGWFFLPVYTACGVRPWFKLVASTLKTIFFCFCRIV